MSRNLAVWEDDGGAAAPALRGTPNQVARAEIILRLVDAEFIRVANALRTLAAQQDPRKRATTEAILAILEDKRTEVLSQQEAYYFIHDWQEISDQVRSLLLADPRYQSIQRNRNASRAGTS
ncbi:hypothetical protein [Bryobacter aggregatus]|uniref:hypothetical protein n=1 Tax=Bryobacter aggregatus TaxID=360054 RepID=UPI0004E217AC|nr:hypothetical protein [Bryobacter aggregatus]